MKGKKTIFLVLALLVPVAIFIFLKMFGRNEFDVPVMHQDSIPSISTDCHIGYTTPYRVADSVMTMIRRNKSDSLCVIFFDDSSRAGMNRISVEFSDDPLEIVSIQDLTSASDFPFLKRCILLMDEDMSVALVDHENRIRGYYDGNDRDEIDRLIVEIKIILKKF
jgi:hypothetical protein